MLSGFEIFKFFVSDHLKNLRMCFSFRMLGTQLVCMSLNNRAANLHGIQVIFVPGAYRCVISHSKSCDDLVLS